MVNNSTGWLITLTSEPQKIICFKWYIPITYISELLIRNTYRKFAKEGNYIRFCTGQSPLRSLGQVCLLQVFVHSSAPGPLWPPASPAP